MEKWLHFGGPRMLTQLHFTYVRRGQFESRKWLPGNAWNVGINTDKQTSKFCFVSERDREGLGDRTFTIKSLIFLTVFYKSICSIHFPSSPILGFSGYFVCFWFFSLDGSTDEKMQEHLKADWLLQQQTPINSLPPIHPSFLKKWTEPKVWWLTIFWNGFNHLYGDWKNSW